jgi:uptake hydrogenase large subunit
MSERVLLGPFGRVEGDLEINLAVADGRIAAAYVNSPLFRGFEQLLVGRAPLDALAIVPRICGICSVSQSLAAATALADAAGVRPTPNGTRASNLVLATENVTDHLSHFYLFFMPDFAHTAYAGHSWHAAAQARFAAISGAATAPFLTARANFLHLMGFLAGKWPHTLALQPGGSSRAIQAGERIRILAQLRDSRRFLEETLFGDDLEAVAALADKAALSAWAQERAGDFPHFLRIAASLDLEHSGRATDAFLSFGAYRDEHDVPLFTAGTHVDGGNAPFDPTLIREDHCHAWLVDERGPLHPAQGNTLVEIDKAGAYSWCKAPRYDGRVVEVGALARQLIAGQPLLRDLTARHGGNVLARVVARLLEVARLLPAMEHWARALRPGEPFCAPAIIPPEGRGVGLIEAARGSLGHWVEYRRGRIARYQIVAPTTWNFAPRDGNGQPGALEQALVGLTAAPDAPAIQHVIRSFDPCMVCTVH